MASLLIPINVSELEKIHTKHHDHSFVSKLFLKLGQKMAFTAPASLDLQRINPQLY